MKNYVENLGESDASNIFPILRKLKDNAMLSLNPKSTPSEKILARKNFQILLEEDLEQATNHRSWKYLLFNILIAATGVGLIPLVIHYGIKGHLFFANSEGHKLCETIENAWEQVIFPQPMREGSVDI